MEGQAETMGKKALIGLGVIFMVLGIYSVATTAYQDYRDFKIMRAWIIRAEQAAQRQAKPAPQAPAPAVEK